MKHFATLAAIAALATASMADSASAQVRSVSAGTPVIASYHVRGLCLDTRATDNAVLLWTCHGAGNQAFRFVSGNYGLISLGNGQCLTGASRGSVLTVRACNNRDQRQKWGFQPDGSLRNETSLCADVEGASHNQGARIISWDCNSASNQKWYPGVSTASVSLGLAGLSAMAGKTNINALISSGGFSSGNLVAAGGGNLVAAGGGNLVAAGGGNLVAAGGGNLVVGGAGSLIAAGGGNLVAAGGGNVVPTNAGNIVPNNWSFFNSSAAGNFGGN